MALDPTSMLPPPGTIVAALGGTAGVVSVAFLWLRKYLSGEAVDRSANKAQTDVITMLNQQLAAEQARSDRLQAALDASTTQIREFQQQIFDLTLEVKNLRAQISARGVAP